MEIISDINEHSFFDAVILADGDFPTHRIPLAILSNAKCLVCCDGAGNKAMEHGIQPDAVVGDGDSLSQDVRMALGDRLHIVAEQEYNDLTKATRWVMANVNNVKTIAYLGTTGKREDHTLANISLMPFYVREFAISPLLVTDYGSFAVAEGCTRFQTYPGQQVSIFNQTCSQLSSEGFRWQSYAYKMMWQGALNEAVGSEVQLDGDGMYMVFRNY